MEDLRKAKFLNGLIARQSLISITVLRWIRSVLYLEEGSEENLPLGFFRVSASKGGASTSARGSKGLSLLPLFLQFIITAVTNYPLQRQDAFFLLAVRMK